MNTNYHDKEADIIEAVLNANFLIKDRYIPKKIYKYRTLNDWDIKNIKNHQVRLTDPNNFNDPYDSALSYTFSVDESINVNELKSFLASQGHKISKEEESLFNRINKGEKIAEILSKASNIQLAECEKKILELEQFMSQLITEKVNSIFPESSLKICSFTTSNDNLLMWSHYANEHKGFCIEYELPSSPIDELRRFLYPVFYKKEIFKTQSLNLKPEQQWAQALIASLFKSKDWSYENEWRLILIGGIGGDFYPMPKPSAVYLGSKIEDNELYNVLIDELKNNEIKTYKMKISNQKFKMIPEVFNY